ncbi:MAG: phospho-N-acetylmuramoyl-pentapeptide-transferase [Lentisphaerae bacterium GWF2_52_8]|nr:MAG: phospho-N-acetylmuramoyl-pentapeptide-transferase [Lentisphaerae bacterium GWF2_52_8]
MFYYIFYKLLYSPDTPLSFFRLFRYITFRSIYAALTSLALSFIIGPIVIGKLKKMQVLEVIREGIPQSHSAKGKTPTMGGIIILLCILISVLLWARLDNIYVLLLIFTMLSLGLIGYIDDYLKIKEKGKKGLIPRYKLAGQFIIGAIVIMTLILSLEPSDSFIYKKLFIPYLKVESIYIGAFFIPLSIFIMVWFSNAVNLTDGLDGLAIGSIIFSALALTILTYVTGHFQFARYLKIPFIDGTSEMAVFLAALLGASMGFLWFNSYPASVFMGDVGSLALGGILGAAAIFIKQEILIIIIGGIYVIEALSVVLQVISFKIWKKRIFLMAPIHHHFELKGWSEPKVIVRFWIIEIIFMLISLSALKIR